MVGLGALGHRGVFDFDKVADVDLGAQLRASPTTLPGIVTSRPLQVAYVPDRGYVYLADFGSGNLLVLRISPTPLAPEDAVAPPPA